MPSARMMPDGTLSVSAGFFKNTQHYAFAFQATPWLEAAFRYSGLTHFDPLYPVYYDRSFALKLRLWDETDVWPAVSLGINDMVGTGIYAGEYLVASKRIGALDISAGMGWGRLGTANTVRNPLRLISESFATSRINGQPGDTNFKTLFHGPTVGLFGGLSWDTPIEGLTLSAEYSSDSYDAEAIRGNFKPSSQTNFGASYRIFDSTTINVGWLYGESIAGSLVFSIDPTHEPYSERISTPPAAPRFRTDEERLSALRALLGREPAPVSPRLNAMANFIWSTALQTEAVSIQENTLQVLVAAGDARVLCSRIAMLAAQDGEQLEWVQISTAGGTPARCPVASVVTAVSGNLRTVASASAAPQAALLGNAVVTIDASRGTGTDYPSTIAAIKRDAAAQGLPIQALALRNGQAILYYTNLTYFLESEAVERLARILMLHAPPEIERFRITNVLNGVPQREFDLLRAPMERDLIQYATDAVRVNSNNTSPASLQNPDLSSANRGSYPRFSWGLFPQFRQQLFDPNNPFAVQLLGAAQATLELLPGLSMRGSVETSMFDNFNTARISDSVLPHVRTDYLSYFVQGKTGVGQLSMEYRFRLAPNVFAATKVGYLESMFAGFGGEVLWRPEGQRWALGADLYALRQREFDRLLGLRSYQTLTGHVSLYYASPWYDLNFALRAGRYLARDNGLTVEVTRRFATGVEIGAFFTKTNVSAQNFGEGSFDKGILIRIPLNFMLPINTQGVFGMDLRPIQRDGGQRLDNDATLFEETRRASNEEMWRARDSGN